MWIEIGNSLDSEIITTSLPTRECGLKLLELMPRLSALLVTPYAGVWIEIARVNAAAQCVTKSLPTRECGLKFHRFYCHRKSRCVTPYAGVWIEISSLLLSQTKPMRHSLRGSVD